MKHLQLYTLQADYKQKKPKHEKKLLSNYNSIHKKSNYDRKRLVGWFGWFDTFSSIPHSGNNAETNHNWHSWSTCHLTHPLPMSNRCVHNGCTTLEDVVMKQCSDNCSFFLSRQGESSSRLSFIGWHGVNARNLALNLIKLCPYEQHSSHDKKLFFLLFSLFFFSSQLMLYKLNLNYLCVGIESPHQTFEPIVILLQSVLL